MALSDTIVALNCVKPCPESLVFSDEQFFALLIDKLATAAGITLSEVTQGDLADATEDGLCALQDRAPQLAVSSETLKALALYLAGEL